MAAAREETPDTRAVRASPSVERQLLAPRCLQVEVGTSACIIDNVFYHFLPFYEDWIHGLDIFRQCGQSLYVSYADKYTKPI